jgi:hypothetical protein
MKRNKSIYWIATIWLALGMVSSAGMQLFKANEEVAGMVHLGYPVYFLTMLGVWKILGVAALLIPGYPVLKEWAYAGFFFAMSGALFSHIALGDPMTEIIPSLLLLALTLVSWYFRPAGRKVISLFNKRIA